LGHYKKADRPKKDTSLKTSNLVILRIKQEKTKDTITISSSLDDGFKPDTISDIFIYNEFIGSDGCHGIFVRTYKDPQHRIWMFLSRKLSLIDNFVWVLENLQFPLTKQQLLEKGFQATGLSA
jgi:hypothetical protein